ncbi:Lysine-epsilon oxidase antimicrobial protein LodA, partial [hydrothermal vent metagenome]
SPAVAVKGPFKENGKIKKQASRFRVYEFEVDEFGNERVIQEIVSSDSVNIKWGVHLRNSKAASRTIPEASTEVRNPGYDQQKLIIEGRDSIEGSNKKNQNIVGQIDFIKNNQSEGRDNVVLGHLETDDSGRLLVVGGDGVSKSPLGATMNSFANNPGWYDDCCDGPISAEVLIGNERVAAEKAWVVIASPAYAPDIYNVVSWYDQARNIEARAYNPSLNLRTPSFTQDIYPILRRISLLQWVSLAARGGHGKGGGGDFISEQSLAKLSDTSQSSKASRQHIFSRLMEPGTAAPTSQTLPQPPRNMPLLYSGVDPQDRTKFQYASLTPHQYTLMKKWADGDFVADWNGPPVLPELHEIPLAEQPDALNSAALTACIGGPFYPGIETTYIMTLAQTYEAPCRINQSLPAGYLTELMALPWQADFVACGAFWWPAQRPVSVKVDTGFEEFSRGVNGFGGMVQYWNELGFVIADGDSFVESERGDIP